jgi:hypothetical protein
MMTEKVKKLVEESDYQLHVLTKLHEWKKISRISYAQYVYGRKLATKKFTKEFNESVSKRIWEQLNNFKRNGTI